MFCDFAKCAMSCEFVRLMRYPASSQNDKATSRGHVAVGGGPEWGKRKGRAEVKQVRGGSGCGCGCDFIMMLCAVATGSRA